MIPNGFVLNLCMFNPANTGLRILLLLVGKNKKIFDISTQQVWRKVEKIRDFKEVEERICKTVTSSFVPIMICVLKFKLHLN